ncbi:MAG: hypothetical protein RJA99_3995 [Pseudomonadota bacterium]|jgi:DNA-binding transcriptional LysR family regulator
MSSAAVRRGAARAAVPSAPRARVSLRQLEAFCAVMTAGGASAAAARLARTQSAVSTAVAELEDALEAPLFERAGRGLRPTEAARRLLPRALELVERALELPAHAVGSAADERLRIGASRTIGPFVMPALLARFAAERPRATIELSIGNTAGQLARLRRFELDAAFVEGDVHEPGLEVRAWAQDALCLVARAGHPVLGLASARRGARAARAYVDALAGAGWAVREPGSGSLETFLRAMAPMLGVPRIGLTVDDPLALQRLVEHGDWLGCVSRRAAADALAAGRLRELPAPDAEAARALVRRFWIVRSPERWRSAALERLVAMAIAPGALTPPRAAPRSAPGPRSRR